MLSTLRATPPGPLLHALIEEVNVARLLTTLRKAELTAAWLPSTLWADGCSVVASRALLGHLHGGRFHICIPFTDPIRPYEPLPLVGVLL